MNKTVPVDRLNVPLFVKLPARFNDDGEFSIPDMVMWLKLGVDEPEMLVVPLNTIVPEELLNVPLSVKLPATFTVPLGAVRVPEIVTLLNEHVLEPLIVVVPPKVTVPEPEFKVPLFARLPLI